MQVIKRDGTPQPIDFEKIHWRIKSMCANPDILKFQKEQRPDAYSVFHRLSPIRNADVDAISKKTIDGVFNNISTTDIDKLSAEIAQEMCTVHPDNSVLATRLLVSNLQKNIVEIMRKRFPDIEEKEIKCNLFKYSMRTLYFNLDSHHENHPLIAPYLAAISDKYSDKINEILDYSRDFVNHDYLGIKTLEKGYLFTVHEMEGFSEKNVIVESPSMSDMRIAIALTMAPSPCPNPYAKDQVLSFIENNLDVIKAKCFKRYSTKQILQELSASDQPHKHKFIDGREFKRRYWVDQLEKLRNIEVTETQWQTIKDIYDGMSTGKFTPATPTRFAAGSLRPQGSSCFLIAMQDDSLKGIYDTLQEQSQIAKHAGGIGIWAHNIRSTGSYIAGTNGRSDGLKPMIQVFDASSKYANQSGKRAGSCVIYLEPWHADIFDFVQLKKKRGNDTDRARALFYALWIPDEFFRCLKEKKEWYLFDPAICPKLYNSYDEKFSSNYLSDDFVNENKLDYLFTYHYRKYIRQGKFVNKISIESLMEEIVETVRDSGVPYMLSKDSCNRKSNQKNLGVIKSSNLCAEIVQYSDSESTSVCNLSSICLNKFVRPFKEGDNDDFKYNVSLNETPEYCTFDFEEFGKTVRLIQNYIDRIIDTNYYPTEKSRNSNMKTRPCGLGLQAEADMLAMLRLPWNSKESRHLRFNIMERMYYECLSASVELAKVHGPYESFNGSPASQGKLQFDLWRDEGKKISFNLSLPWDELKANIKRYGIRNSLTSAMMPTASTSNIMGNSPSIEPFNSLVYIRKSGAGDVTIINNNLVKDLMSLGMWNKQMSDKILQEHGSIQNVTELPKKLRDSYLTVYDMEPEDIIDAAYVRAWFVDQSQSMNLFIKNVTMNSLTKAWTRGWMRGLKTLSYYCRSRGAIFSQKAQISLTNNTNPPSPQRVTTNTQENSKQSSSHGSAPERIPGVCYRDDPDCLSCGS